jgi:hypothetical protein
MFRSKIVLTGIAALMLAGCAGLSATSASATSGARTTATTTSTAGMTKIVVWSVNSDGPDFRSILTGAVGDYGPAVTVLPDGATDPSHSNDLELKLSRGSFKISIAKLDAAFVAAVTHWPYNATTCSIHGSITGAAPVVAGSGTGAYRDIAGSFTLTLSLDEDWVRGPGCTESTAFSAQLLQLDGTGYLS